MFYTSCLMADDYNTTSTEHERARAMVEDAANLMGLNIEALRERIERDALQRKKMDKTWEAPSPPKQEEERLREVPEVPERLIEPPEWVDRVASLERKVGHLEGLLSLADRAERVLKAERDRLVEDLKRERERADQERGKTEQAGQQAEALVAELEQARWEAQHKTEQLEQERALVARLQRKNEDLRAELKAELYKGFFRRLFGG